MSLTPFACSVHTHSVLCDGENSLAEMAAAAYAAGLRVFGASGHSPTPIPHDEGNVLPADMTAYREEVLRLRAAYEGRMEVLLGIEQDSCSRRPPPDWAEYWIGSVHNLYDPGTGKYHGIDWDTEKLAACREEMFGGDLAALLRRYYADVAAMAARKPTILGHLDLITKFNEGGALFDEEDPGYRRAALEALHAADPSATLLEINTGAMARGYRRTPYPARFLLREWRRMGGQVILSADAHSAAGIVYGYGAAAEWAGAAGFQRCAVLTRRGAVLCPLS